MSLVLRLLPRQVQATGIGRGRLHQHLPGAEALVLRELRPRPWTSNHLQLHMKLGPWKITQYPNPSLWKMTYTPPGEDARQMSFELLSNRDMADLKGLLGRYAFKPTPTTTAKEYEAYWHQQDLDKIWDRAHFWGVTCQEQVQKKERGDFNTFAKCKEAIARNSGYRDWKSMPGWAQKQARNGFRAGRAVYKKKGDAYHEEILASVTSIMEARRKGRRKKSSA